MSEERFPPPWSGAGNPEQRFIADVPGSGLVLPMEPGDVVEPGSDFINSVPRDQYGTWCQHGKHIFVVDDTDPSPYPGTVAADPWPCSVCTPEGVAAEMSEEAEQERQSVWPL